MVHVLTPEEIDGVTQMVHEGLRLLARKQENRNRMEARAKEINERRLATRKRNLEGRHRRAPL
jgi:hypothetical protein